MGAARDGDTYAKSHSPDRRGAPVGLAQLGPARGIAGEAWPVGRPRGAAGCPRADMGFAGRGAPTTWRRARTDVGISSAPFRRPSALCACAGLGRTAGRGFAAGARHAGRGARMGRGRARTVVGRAAAGRACAAAYGCGTCGTAPASASGSCGTAPAGAAIRSAGRGAVVEFIPGACRAGLGCARRPA